MKRIICAIIVMSLSHSMSALAKTPLTQKNVNSPITDNIRAALKQKFADLNVDSIQESPIKGLYEAKIGTVVFYISQDTQHIVQGDIFDTKRDKADQNLTEIVRRHARADILKQSKVNEMIVYAPKNPKGVMTIFADTDCNYSRQLHADIPKLNDLGIEVRYLAYPRTAQGTGAYDKAVSIWCAEDPKSALNAAAKGEKVAHKTCINSVASQVEMGQRFGVKATPTVIFPDGNLVPGYIAPEVLAKEAIAHSSKNI